MSQFKKTIVLGCFWFLSSISESHSTQKIMTEPAYEEACRKIAREIVMVDEKFDNLKDRYEEVLNIAFSRSIAAPSSKKDVLILGAGIAGLVAGKILQKEGYYVTILEANGNRVGGRIKTFHHEDGQEAPFMDNDLYAEAGAMRIPTSHPLVQTLIDILHLKHQQFYNVDEKRDAPGIPGNHTWYCANGVQKRPSEYASLDLPPAERHLGFALPEKYYGKTAKRLLDEAFASDPLLTATTRNPDLSDNDKGENERLVGAWEAVINKYDKWSMLEYLQEKYPERVVIDYIGTLQNLSSRLFLSFIHSFVDTFYISPTTKYREVIGGNYRLPYAVADEFGRRNIVMNARAVEIQWASPQNPASPVNKNIKAINRGRDGVYVRTVGERVDEDNKAVSQPMDREFTADYLITSIPFSALRFVDVHPRFSYDKHRAITEMHYDSATKVFLEFSERFWEWNEGEWIKRLSEEYRGHNSIGGGVVTDSPNRFIYFPGIPPKEGSIGGIILASYTWSDDANRWDSILPSDRVAYALRGLTDIYGKGILRFFTGKSQTESWMQNFYAYGEAAVFSPGQILGLYPNTSTPEGPIHFAGEHTSMKHAWIEGAIESGIRAALEIIERDKAAL